MSITSSFDAAPQQPLSEIFGDYFRRIPRVIWLLAIFLFGFAGVQPIMKSLQTPGGAIRSELMSAAAEFEGRISPQPSAADIHAIERHFLAHPVTVDAARTWPQVQVTLRGVDRETCLDVRSSARRMEGLVVVDLLGYASAADCNDSNDMAWRIMP